MKFIYLFYVTFLGILVNIQLLVMKNLLCGDDDRYIAAGLTHENGHWGCPVNNPRDMVGCKGCGTTSCDGPPPPPGLLELSRLSTSSTSMCSSSSLSDSPHVSFSCFVDNSDSTLNDIFDLMLGSVTVDSWDDILFTLSLGVWQKCCHNNNCENKLEYIRFFYLDFYILLW